MKPMQPGDVPVTWADTTILEEITAYQPAVSLKAGVERFAQWFRNYYGR
jgi:UDP-glucuronate 4-epimerase